MRKELRDCLTPELGRCEFMTLLEGSAAWPVVSLAMRLRRCCQFSFALCPRSNGVMIPMGFLLCPLHHVMYRAWNFLTKWRASAKVRR